MDKNKKLTRFGKYLKKLGARPSKITTIAKVKPKIISLLSTDSNRTIYAEEFYKIILVAIKQANLPEQTFETAVEDIFPDREKDVDLLEEFGDYSPEAKFFKSHMQQQSSVEKRLKIPEGKLSKYFGDQNKRILATEMIAFIEGMGYDILKTFKEIYGEIELDKKDEIGEIKEE